MYPPAAPAEAAISMDFSQAKRNSLALQSTNERGAPLFTERLCMMACASGTPQPASCSAIPRTSAASSRGACGKLIFAANSPASAAWEGCVIIQQPPLNSRDWRSSRSTTLQAGRNSALSAGGGSSGRKIIKSSAWTPLGHAARHGHGLGGTAAGRRLFHSVQQLFERDRIVALRILCGIDQRHL